MLNFISLSAITTVKQTARGEAYVSVPLAFGNKQVNAKIVPTRNQSKTIRIKDKMTRRSGSTSYIIADPKLRDLVGQEVIIQVERKREELIESID